MATDDDDDDDDDRLWLFYVFTKQVKEDTILAEYNGPLDAVDAYTHSVGYDILLSNVVLVLVAIPYWASSGHLRACT